MFRGFKIYLLIFQALIVLFLHSHFIFAVSWAPDSNHTFLFAAGVEFGNRDHCLFESDAWEDKQMIMISSNYAICHDSMSKALMKAAKLVESERLPYYFLVKFENDQLSTFYLTY